MTVVEFTVHCQTRLRYNVRRNIKARLIAGYFNRYKGCISLFFISKCSEDKIISYMEVYAMFYTRMDFTEMSVMSLDFAEIKKKRKHVRGDDIQDALSPSTAIF